MKDQRIYNQCNDTTSHCEWPTAVEEVEWQLRAKDDFTQSMKINLDRTKMKQNENRPYRWLIEYKNVTTNVNTNAENVTTNVTNHEEIEKYINITEREVKSTDHWPTTASLFDHERILHRLQESAPTPDESILIIDSAANQSSKGQGFEVISYLGQPINIGGALTVMIGGTYLIVTATTVTIDPTSMK